MPVARFQMPDGRIGRFEVPDGTTPEQAQQLIEQQISQGGIQAAPQVKQPAAPTDEQKTRASIPARFAYGVAQPMIGFGQLLAHGISAGEQPGTFLGDMAQNVDDYWTQQDQAQKAAKKATGTGADVAGFVGNVVSPANALIALAAPAAPVSMAGKMALGAGIGGASGAMQPVTGDGDFASEKAAQVGIGAAAGGALSGLIGAAANKISQWLKPQDLNSPETLQKANAAINEAIRENGSDPANYAPDILDKLRDHILNGLKDGKEINAAAQLRKTDFESAGIQPLLGQITRDPTQFSQERNLRGAIPELAGVFQGQGETLRKQIGQYSGDAADAYQGGNKLIDALRSADNASKANVTALYTQARESAGKDLEVPLQGLSQDYARIANDFQEKIPGGVRKKFEDLGLLSGKQLKLFTVEDADKLLKTINDHVGNDNATNNALSQLRGAVKSAVNAMDSEGGVFAPAVKAAKERFSLHDAIPALKAVAEGNAMPDNFAQKYIINGKADEVKRLADALKQSSPEAYQEARNQLGASIERAAYGENAAGDAALRPEMFSKALRQIGNEKLSAFFSKDEIAKLQQLNRVGAYINKSPDAASVNYSNSATALLGNAPGLINQFGRNIPGSALLQAGANAVKNQTAANTAIKANVPFKKAELTPDQKRLVSALIYGGGLAGGLFGGSSEKP